MGTAPRVAFFADSFHEVNGLALTARSLDAFARRHARPFLCVRGSTATADQHGPDGGTIDLARSAASIPLDVELAFDPLWPRHVRRVMRALERFRPDIVHITGINDMGQLGAWAAYRRRLPLVASWHTNVHEFAARRVRKLLRAFGTRTQEAIAGAVERAIWRALVQFYRMPRAVFVPNEPLARQLQSDTRRPAYLMRRGVDTSLFSPARREPARDVFRIGYVGRIAPEKNVRLLASLEAHLLAQAAPPFEIVVVGEGSERGWLEQTMSRGVFLGVLQGEALARAYASMDVFAFPSETDTFGNVVLEALASGVPAIVTDRGGPQSVIRPGLTGLVAAGVSGFAEAVLGLMRDRARHETMRAAARAQACEYAWDAVFERVYDVYSTVVEDARRAGDCSAPPRSAGESAMV